MCPPPPLLPPLSLLLPCLSLTDCSLPLRCCPATLLSRKDGQPRSTECIPNTRRGSLDVDKEGQAVLPGIHTYVHASALKMAVNIRPLLFVAGDRYRVPLPLCVRVTRSPPLFPDKSARCPTPQCTSDISRALACSFFVPLYLHGHRQRQYTHGHSLADVALVHV